MKIIALWSVTEIISEVSKYVEYNSNKEGNKNNKLLEWLFKIKKICPVTNNQKDGDFIENFCVNRRKRIKKNRGKGKEK